MSEDIKLFKVECHYHTDEVANFQIHARTEEDALEIANIKFCETFTERCRLDFIKLGGTS